MHTFLQKQTRPFWTLTITFWMQQRVKPIFMIAIALVMFLLITPTIEAQSSTRAITIKNTGSTTIYDIHIVPTTSSTWGRDQLSTGETIAPGEQITFYLSYRKSYHLLAEDFRGRDIAQLNNIYMSFNRTWTIDEVALVVENNSLETVCFMHITPWNSGTWGSDQLESDETIRPNRQRTFYVNPGLYDLLAKDCDGREITSTEDANLYSAGRWTIGETVDLTLINRSGGMICKVYISPVSEGWGDDWLGSSEVVLNNRQRTFTVNAGTYDLKATDCFNNAIEMHFDVTLDDDMRWTVTD